MCYDISVACILADNSIITIKRVIFVSSETYRCCGAETSFDLGYMAWEDNHILKPSKARLYLRQKTLHTSFKMLPDIFVLVFPPKSSKIVYKENL